MSGLAKRPLCGRCEAGWLYDESGDEAIVTPCPCRTASTTPERERDAALTSTAESNPQALKAALAIIRETALAMPVFSSNDTRHRMKLAQIPPEVIGTAFRQAARDGVIRGDSYIASDDPGTHAHPVRSWASRIYQPGRATA